jgi:hypothetical protein
MPSKHFQFSRGFDIDVSNEFNILAFFDCFGYIFSQIWAISLNFWSPCLRRLWQDKISKRVCPFYTLV